MPCEPVHSFEVPSLRAFPARFSLVSQQFLFGSKGVIVVLNGSKIFASLVTMAMLATAPVALADDPIKDVVDREVPALKNGSRIPMPDIESAILAACARRHFTASVTEPGVITARWERRGHWFDVTIPYTNESYSIRYKDSHRMDYNPNKQRIDDNYNDFVSGLSEHIDADFERALDRIKELQKRVKKDKKVARINPRYAA